MSLSAGQRAKQSLAGAAAGDLESILSLIKELLVAKNTKQAAQHYQSMQQVGQRENVHCLGGKSGQHV